jgi:hypothetical protein
MKTYFCNSYTNGDGHHVWSVKHSRFGDSPTGIVVCDVTNRQDAEELVELLNSYESKAA